MKNILITTALISLLSSAAMADAPSSMGPEVTAGGLVTFETGTNNKKGRNLSQGLGGNSEGATDVIFNTTAKAHVKATGRADSGFTYGGVVGLTTNTRHDSNVKDNKLDNTYMFLETGLGRVELGSNHSAAFNMKKDASNIARASGGIDGNWSNYYQVNSNYMSSPDFLSDLYPNSKESAIKLTYYTPSFSGFQFGVSYAPNGTRTGDSNNTLVGFGNGRVINHLVNGGLTYTNKFDQFETSVSLLVESGKSNTSMITDKKSTLRGWQVGTTVDFAGVVVAGSYGSTNKSFLNSETPTDKNAKYWTAGASFVQGPFGVSATYLNSKLSENTLKNLVVGADYQLAPYMLPYVEAAFVDTKNSAGTKNKGQVYLLGTEFRF